MKRIFALTAALALLAAACGSGDSETTTVPEPAATEAPAATAAPAATTAPPAADAVSVATSALGDVLVDASGNTLYLFLPDDQGESTCYDGCAANWPPLTGDVAAGDGADAALIGTTTRTDGTDQVTYNGWPLYYFANDAAAGDTNGQGINDVWFVVTATGDSVQ